MFHSRQC